MAASLVGQLALAVTGDLDRFRSDLRSQAPRIGDEVGTTLGARIKARPSAANIGTAIGATLGGLSVGALHLADRYDDAMDTIRVGTGATGEALRGLEADFAAVAGRVPADIGLVGQVVADLNTRTGQTGEGLRDLAAQIPDAVTLGLGAALPAQTETGGHTGGFGRGERGSASLTHLRFRPRFVLENVTLAARSWPAAYRKAS